MIRKSRSRTIHRLSILDVYKPLACTIVFIVRTIMCDHACYAQASKLEVLKHSKTMCNVLAINDRRDVIGIREVPLQSSISQVSFFQAFGKKPVDLPKLKGYTHIELEGLSDTGLVVGYASRAEAKPGKTTAFVWDSRSGEIHDLGQLPDDVNAHAQDISADGKRITGYSLGSDPARLRPCLWEYIEKEKKWIPQALPTIDVLNPFLQAGRVVISPNGQWIAGCAAVKHYSESVVDSSLMLWQQNGDKWERRLVHDEQPKLKDINDSGTMVGSSIYNNEVRACVITIDGQFEWVDLLDGDVSNAALGINNSGTIVGYSDAPSNADGGPRAFVLKGGRVRALDLGEHSVCSSASCISQDGVIAGYIVHDTDEESPLMGFLLQSEEK